jgi:hypothetical protein
VKERLHALHLLPRLTRAAWTSPLVLALLLHATLGRGLRLYRPSALHSEVASLGQPRAALLAVGVAVLAYNAFAVLQAAVCTPHAAEVAADVDEVSLYCLADERGVRMTSACSWL